jgi:hypothetical protein
MQKGILILGGQRSAEAHLAYLLPQLNPRQVNKYGSFTERNAMDYNWASGMSGI